MQEKLSLVYLPNHQNIKLYQHQDMFKINTVTCCFGEFVVVGNQESVLDIGTNNGVLLLYASIFNPKQMVGIDINQQALEIAQMNMQLNQINNVQLIHSDAKDYTGEDKFDIIIANPPFFNSAEHLKNKNPFLRMARHEEYLDLPILLACINRNLKKDGRFYLVHQAMREDEITSILKKNHFGIKRKKYIYDSNKNEAGSILFEIKKWYNDETTLEEDLIIKRSSGE